MFFLVLIFTVILAISNFGLLFFFSNGAIFTTPVFFAVLTLTAKNYRTAVISGILFSKVVELYSGFHSGTIVLSFLLTFLTHALFNKFINLKSPKFYQENSAAEFFLELFSAAGLVYIFSIFRLYAEKLFYYKNLTWSYWTLIFYNHKALLIIIIQVLLLLIFVKYLKLPKNKHVQV